MAGKEQVRQHREQHLGEGRLPLPGGETRLEVVVEEGALQGRQGRRPDVASTVAAKTTDALKKRAPGNRPKVPLTKKLKDGYHSFVK